MVSRALTLKNTSGLHARPASLLVGIANRYQARIRVRREGKEADGKSILSLMMLAASPGAGIVIEADGEDEDDALAALATLVESRFGEDG